MSDLHIDISALITTAQAQLLTATPHTIDYVEREALKNSQLPASLRTSPINIYALWRRERANSDWELMYIGQRSFRSGWSRVEQHLFATPQGTQSKLNEVRAAIESGAQIGVTAIRVEPDSMRLSIEEELINRNSQSADKLLWNKKARAKSPRVARSRARVDE